MRAAPAGWRGGRRPGRRKWLGRLVSYADDFVILCASRRQAEESLALVSRWLKKLGLTLNPAKTRLCQAREEPFDFLGYTFGPALPDRLLHRGDPTPWPEMRKRLNWLISGWSQYFSFGHVMAAHQAVRWHIGERVRRFLRRRHKLPLGTGRFGFREVYGKLGVLDLHQLRRS